MHGKKQPGGCFLFFHAMSKVEEKRFFIDNLRGVWYSESKRKKQKKADKFMSKYEKAEVIK